MGIAVPRAFPCSPVHPRKSSLRCHSRNSSELSPDVSFWSCAHRAGGAWPPENLRLPPRAPLCAQTVYLLLLRTPAHESKQESSRTPMQSSGGVSVTARRLLGL